MDENELQHKKDFLRKLKRRRNERELQRAQYGSMADPSIKMDIEDITEAIEKTEREIEQLQQQTVSVYSYTSDSTIETKGASSMSSESTTVDVAILTVLHDEYWQIYHRLSNPRPAPSSSSSPNLYNWAFGSIPTSGGKSYVIALGMIGRAGTTSSALATINAITSWRPAYVFFVGIAGGFDREGLQKGHVVIADVIYGYEYGKLEKEFIPRHNWVYQTDGSLFTKAIGFGTNPRGWITKGQDSSEQPPRRVLSGPIASGDKVIDDPTNEYFAQVLRTWPKLLAVEMEGAGLAAAIAQARDQSLSVGYLMIRGISDMPRSEQEVKAKAQDARGTQERDAWKSRAADRAADFTVAFIADGLPIPPTQHAPKSEPTAAPQTMQPRRNQPVTVDTRDLRRRMVQKFDDERLDLLCGDINALLKQAGETTTVSRAIVGGRGLEAIILNLIQYLERRGLLSFLVDALRDVEPDII